MKYRVPFLAGTIACSTVSHKLPCTQTQSIRYLFFLLSLTGINVLWWEGERNIFANNNNNHKRILSRQEKLCACLSGYIQIINILNEMLFAYNWNWNSYAAAHANGKTLLSAYNTWKVSAVLAHECTAPRRIHFPSIHSRRNFSRMLISHFILHIRVITHKRIFIWHARSSMLLESMFLLLRLQNRIIGTYYYWVQARWH